MASQLPESEPSGLTKRVAGTSGATGGAEGTRTVIPGATGTREPPATGAGGAAAASRRATRRSAQLPSAQAITRIGPSPADACAAAGRRVRLAIATLQRRARRAEPCSGMRRRNLAPELEKSTRTARQFLR